MKKENQAIAKKMRAQAQKKAKRSAILKKGILIIVLLVVFVAAVVFALTDEPSNEDTTPTTISDENASSDASYDTDTSLVVKDGDKVNIDYIGYMDGEEFSGGNTNGNGTSLVIGSDSYIDGFEDQLIGHNVGETVEVKTTFPDPYPNNTDYSGKEATFVVTINGIYPTE